MTTAAACAPPLPFPRRGRRPSAPGAWAPPLRSYREASALGWSQLRYRGRETRSTMARPPILSVALPSDTGRVLSIQSHTVQGYVGNKSAVFPLQLLGFDVDPINSVQFSNHTGYPTFRGQVLNGNQLWDLIEGLEENQILHYTHLLTGYIGSVSFLETVLQVVEKLRSVNPGLVYGSGEGSDHSSYVRNIFLHFCKRLFPGLEPMTSWLQCNNFIVAPEEGSDHFGSYVHNISLLFCKRLFLGLEVTTSWSQGNNFTVVPEEGSDHFGSYVRIITLHFCKTLFPGLEPMPSWSQGNSFTAAPGHPFFCDPVLGDEGKLYVPQELIFVYQQKVVPVASMLTPNQFEVELLTGLRVISEQDGLTACNTLHNVGPRKVVITSALIEGKLLLIGSHRKTEEQPPEQFKIEIPKIPAYFTGTGDLTTALLLGWSNKYPDNLEMAAELAVSSLQAVLKRTVEDYKRAGFDPSSSSLEIRLIQSQDDIRTPAVTCRAVKYS